MPDTTPVTIYGYSDDLLELDTPDRSIYEEFNCFDKCIVVFTAPNGEQVTIYGSYGHSRTSDWMIELMGDNNANWAFERGINPDREEEPSIILHVPVGTTVECLTDADE